MEEPCPIVGNGSSLFGAAGRNRLIGARRRARRRLVPPLAFAYEARGPSDFASDAAQSISHARKDLMKTSFLAAALGLGLLVSGAAYATDAAAPAPSPTPTATVMSKPDKAAMEARSQDCSKEADAQGLKGHKRKVFREKCKRGVK